MTRGAVNALLGMHGAKEPLYILTVGRHRLGAAEYQELRGLTREQLTRQMRLQRRLYRGVEFTFDVEAL